MALHTTAGESDFDSDRLSNLKKVGNGFGPLIYGLMKDNSFEAFRKACLHVWESMEAAPDLPEKLVSTTYLYLQCIYKLYIFSADVNQNWDGTSL